MINVITICNFAQGFKRLVDLGLYFVYKDKLGLEPSEIEMLIGIINFPWVVKMFLGILADNYTLFGSRRKSYLFTACIINLFSLFMLMVFAIKFGKYFITFCIFMTQICMTMCDALTDALVVQSSRIDLNGAQNLNSLTLIAYSLGGILGCSLAGSITLWDSYYQVDGHNKKLLDPNIYFLTYACLILLLTISVLFMS